MSGALRRLEPHFKWVAPSTDRARLERRLGLLHVDLEPNRPATVLRHELVTVLLQLLAEAVVRDGLARLAALLANLQELVVRDPPVLLVNVGLRDRDPKSTHLNST